MEKPDFKTFDLRGTWVAQLGKCLDAWCQLRSWYQGHEFKPRVALNAAHEDYFKKKKKKTFDLRHEQWKEQII